jgi:aerobic-type carbon monoxide dehydrogenase small subunit (CoxS/CutS family)
MNSSTAVNERILKLMVNGTLLTCAASSRETLVDLLREAGGLTGTKVGCDMGTCGCCTVLVDGHPRLGCLTLALECEGRAITTIEGLNEGALHHLSRAFAEKGGSQCGFCTPGFIMSAAGYLKDNPTPTLDDLREALAGNLCRCTGYVKIYEAVLDAAHKLRGNRPLKEQKALT